MRAPLARLLRRSARIRVRLLRAVSLPTGLALVATASLAVFANRLIADGAFLVVGVLALVAAIGTASARRAR